MTRSRLMRVLSTMAWVVLCGWTSPASADPQADRIRRLEERLDANQRLIDRLISRVAELERLVDVPGKAVGPAAAASASAAAPAPAAADATPGLRQLQETVNQLSDGLARASRDTGVPLHGFADVSVMASGSQDPQRQRGFNAGTLDIYLNPQLGERGRALIETVFEYEPGGGMHVETERLQLGYVVSDALTVWMGRFHTPIGIWNTAFHHGSQLQTTLARPRFLEFEDRAGVLPTHTVGVWATGRGRLGDGRFSADLFVGNGPSVRNRVLDINAFADDNAGKQVGGSLAYMPNGVLRGLKLGLHAMATTVQVYNDVGGELSRSRFRLTGAHGAYEENDWSLLAEVHRVNNADTASGARRGNSLWYVQLGRAFGAWTPYARLERAAIDGDDGYFASLQAGRSYRRGLSGVRYDLDARSAFKLELSRTEEAQASLIDGQGLRVPVDAARYNRAAFEYSVAF